VAFVDGRPRYESTTSLHDAGKSAREHLSELGCPYNPSEFQNTKGIESRLVTTVILWCFSPPKYPSLGGDVDPCFTPLVVESSQRLPNVLE